MDIIDDILNDMGMDKQNTIEKRADKDSDAPVNFTETISMPGVSPQKVSFYFTTIIVI